MIPALFFMASFLASQSVQQCINGHRQHHKHLPAKGLSGGYKNFLSSPSIIEQLTNIGLSVTVISKAVAVTL